MAAPSSLATGTNGDEAGYAVRVERADGGWEVRILDPDRAPVAVRHCGDETEARTYASTVRQHAYWLSSERFRAYYRLPEPA